MQTWQKWLLLSLVAFFIIHLVRDLAQAYKIKTFLTTVLVKHDLKQTPGWYWLIFDSYIWCTLGPLASLLAFKTNQFHPYGIVAILSAVIFISAWSIFWFLF